jgi:hypothetical protein
MKSLEALPPPLFSYQVHVLTFPIGLTTSRLGTTLLLPIRKANAPTEVGDEIDDNRSVGQQ